MLRIHWGFWLRIQKRGGYDLVKKTIQASDSANYQAMSWLAQYYLNGMVVNRDIEVAIKLLNKSKNEALKKRDKEYIEKINKVLSRIKEIEHGNE